MVKWQSHGSNELHHKYLLIMATNSYQWFVEMILKQFLVRQHLIRRLKTLIRVTRGGVAVQIQNIFIYV